MPELTVGRQLIGDPEGTLFFAVLSVFGYAIGTVASGILLILGHLLGWWA